jgi:hypothetical protein
LLAFREKQASKKRLPLLLSDFHGDVSPQLFPLAILSHKSTTRNPKRTDEILSTNLVLLARLPSSCFAQGKAPHPTCELAADFVTETISPWRRFFASSKKLKVKVTAFSALSPFLSQFPKPSKRTPLLRRLSCTARFRLISDPSREDP